MSIFAMSAPLPRRMTESMASETVEAEVAYVNAIVDASPWGVGKVHNEAPFP